MRRRSRRPATPAGTGWSGVNSRRQLWTTSAAVSGVPSLNVRPSRSVNVTWRPSSVTAHDSARAGRTVSEGSTAVSVSYSWLTNEALPRSPWRAGSIEAGVPATMVTFTLAGETNDYAGKGLAGGVADGAPARRRRLRRRGERDRRQHRALRRDGRPRLLPRARGRALRRAQLGRPRGRRGRRRPRLRVHDRRARRRARPDRPQLRRRHERRHRLRLRRAPRLRRPLQRRARRARAAQRARRGGAEGPDRRARGAHRLAGRAAACSTTGTRAVATLREGDAARLQARARRARRRGRAPSRHRRRPREPRPEPWDNWAASSRSIGSASTSAIPRERVHDYDAVLPSSSRRRSCADRARAAWTAACRSATRAARSAT